MTLKEYFKNRLYNLINEEETTKSEVVPKPVETDVDKVVDRTKIDRSERRSAPSPSVARTILFGADGKVSGPQIDAPGLKGTQTAPASGRGNVQTRSTSIQPARGLTPEGEAELYRQASEMDATARRVRERRAQQGQ